MPYMEFDDQARPLGPGVLTVGSGPEAGWRIHNHDLASVHALFTIEPIGGAKVAQARPDAAIYVNGEEALVGWRTLEFGDVVRLGRAELVYRLASRPGATRGGAYLHDTRRDRIFKLAEFNEIGRDVKCAILLQEPDVSRTHAELRLVDGAYVLKPLGAVTLVNGERINAERTLREGDVLLVGRTTLRFSSVTPTHGVAAGASRRAGLEKKAAALPTTFMGVIESRERIRRSGHRRVGTIAAAALVAAALFSFIYAARDSRTARRAAAVESSARR